ncbi:MAG: putative oxidoreductase [Hyphomicrobiales bacterium]|nr:putative oxidoreductase [Hyphomicrobiales bacterium]
MTTYLITGANRGIGLELTRQAAASGANVIAAVRDPSKASELNALAASSSGLVEVIALDVADAASIDAAQAKVGARPIDVLVNNAGVMGKAQTVLDMEAEDFLEVMQVNALGPVLVSRTFLPNLRAAGHAKIAVISSLMGSFTYPGASHIAYSTSKTAVNRLFHALARELAPEHIHVAILSPGWVRTDMGGPNATLDVRDSAKGLLRMIAATDAGNSGTGRNYAGDPLHW